MEEIIKQLPGENKPKYEKDYHKYKSLIEFKK